MVTRDTVEPRYRALLAEESVDPGHLTPALRALGEGETLFDVPDDPRWTDALDLRGYRGVRELRAEPLSMDIEFSQS
jgi:hypothetical protein